MEKMNQFSFSRLILLMQRNITFNIKSWMIAFGEFIGVVIIVGLLNTYFSNGLLNINPVVILGYIILFINGFVLTAGTYNELHVPTRSQFYLTLPATTLEKFFSHYLISTVLYVLIANLMLFISILIYAGLSVLIWDANMAYFNPFELQNINLMGIYIVSQSVFFLGAVAFRKYNFLKTILAVFVVQFALNIILALLAWVIIGSPGVSVDVDSQNTEAELTMFFSDTLPTMAKYFTFYVLAPFLLVVSYLKLKEREV